MTLIFENSLGAMRNIALLSGACSDEEAFREARAKIKEFCSERGYEIPYIRMWNTERGGVCMTQFDVGSHTEFFFLDRVIDVAGVR